MNKVLEYLNFIREKGKPLSEINPGSDELALQVEDAFKAIELLRYTQLAIVGGDILSGDFDRLVYAYKLWGSEYHYLNWSCEKNNNENSLGYINRSYEVAKESILKANEVAKRIEKKCYIVLVLSGV